MLSIALSDLKMLQMVTVVLRFVYYVVLVVGLVLYAYERWFEYYEDEVLLTRRFYLYWWERLWW